MVEQHFQKESILYLNSYNTLINSIKNKIYTLSPDIVIYPGHHDISTIEREIINNPYTH